MVYYKNHTKIAFNLYPANIRLLFAVLFFLFSTFVAEGQRNRIVTDTIVVERDSTRTDTLFRYDRQVSPDAVDIPILYNAKGSIRTRPGTRKVYLIEEGEVTYGDIYLKADSIVLDMTTGTVYATGRKDSTGLMIGMPVFKEGGDEFESKELTYNFKSKKGIITNIITEQEGGLLHSETTKRHADGSLHIHSSKFTTCDDENPHFYIGLNRAKVYPGEKIVSGPAFLVLEDIPLPIALPFGFFPVQKTRASGILMPRYGQEAERGYFLSEGGYYFAINDYLDLKATGGFYTNGSWMANAASSYNLRYRFSGNVALGYASNISGHKGLSDYSKGTNYKILWSHNQDAKARPGSRFTASVNMSSSEYDRQNSYSVNEQINTTRNSSISYTKTWDGKPFNFSSRLSHTQNVQNKTVGLNLPQMNFGVSRLYPFRGKNSGAATKWYQDIQIQYTASLDNQINTYDSLLFTRNVWDDMRSGFKHDIPVSVQFRPFRDFNISPQMKYSGVLYTQKYEKRWDPNYFDPNTNQVSPRVITDTITGLFYGQSLNPSISASYNPKVYGMYQFTKEDSRVEAIRHVISPSVSFSFTPVIDGFATKMHKSVQTDTLGRESVYSIFQGNIFGTPSIPSKSGIVSFSLNNLVEAKVFQPNDTTGKAKKVKIIENLGVSTSYNIFADSLHWSPLSANFRTRLFENVSISATSSFSLYGLSDDGKAVAAFAWEQNKKLARLTNFNLSIDFDLGQLLDKRNKSATSGPIPEPESMGGGDDPEGENRGGLTTRSTGLPLDPYGYAEFDVPWSLRMAYNFNYSKYTLTPTKSQTLTLGGDVTFTKKMKFTYTSGYDFTANEITTTSIGVTRDLHCWQMNVSWIPTGYRKMWSFTLRVKASVLQDLKYERRKDFLDNF